MDGFIDKINIKITDDDWFKDFSSMSDTGRDFTHYESETVSPTVGEPVSVTISNVNNLAYTINPLKEGVLMRIKGRKRVWGKVTQAGRISVLVKCVYRPSPKSTLLKKSIFSKVKTEIIPIK